MTLIQIINTILVLLLPALIAACYVGAQWFIQRFPFHQRQALEQFARMSVRHVKRQPDGLDQKKLAMAYTSDMFRLSGLPVPHTDILELAVSSAMYDIERDNG